MKIGFIRNREQKKNQAGNGTYSSDDGEGSVKPQPEKDPH